MQRDSVIQVTLAEAVNTFVRDVHTRQLSPRTERFYRSELDHFCKWVEGEGVSTLGAVTADLIRKYLLDLAERRNEGGVHCAYRSIKAMMMFWARETDGDYTPAIRKVKVKRPPTDPLEPIAKDDFEKLLGACGKDFHGLRDGAILRVLLDTGVRASELCGFDLADLNLADASLLVRRGKGRKTRMVFFGKATRRALRKWLGQRGDDKGGLFCTQAGDRISYWALREIVQRRAKDAEVDAPGLHDFRRGFTLAQLQAGVDVVSISRLLGHSDISLVSRYARQTDADLAEKYQSVVDRDENV